MLMIACIHNLGFECGIGRGGNDISVYTCHERGRCVLTASELKEVRLPGAVTCEGCTLFQRRTRPEFLSCLNRGEETGKRIDCQCGVDKSIYRCAVHGECLKRLPPAKSVEDFGAALDGVTICATCPDVS